jgi:hypothetical protein
LNLPGWFGLNPGALDFFGARIARGAGYDVGAAEY